MIRSLERLEMANGWTTRLIGDYTYYEPVEGMRFKQGWKIHVSFLPRDLEWVTREITEACFARNVPFKIVSDRDRAFSKIAKGESRLSAGKSSAIYAGGEKECLELILELEERLGGLDGPEILTSLRVSERVPIFARYGAFVEMFCPDEQGYQQLAVEMLDGRRVPDRRSVRFSLPEGVEPPDFMEEALRRKKELGTEIGAAGLKVDKVLQYSTGGGVYLGRHRGRQVVIKEARPLVGVDVLMRDAVDRLRDEFAAHRNLEHLEGVPRALGLRQGRRNLFMFREYVEGIPLSVRRHEMRTFLDGAAFALWSHEVMERAHEIVDSIWAEGWGVNDVQPANFICSESSPVSLIDLECVRRLDDETASSLIATRTYTPDPEATGRDRDAGGLAATRLWLAVGFVPPVSGRSIRFLRDVSENLVDSSPGLSLAMDVLQDIGDARDRRATGLDHRFDEIVPVTDEVVASASTYRDVSRSMDALRALANRSVHAAIAESLREESPQVDFWNGVPGARAALGADATSTNGETLAALAPVEEPWKEEGWDAYLVTSGDKRMLNDTVTSAALTAALLGAPFDVVKWAEAVSQRLQRNEHNRSLLNGLAGPLMVCNALGSSGGHQVADLAERLVESMRANECRDKDWTFLQGRAGTAITLIAAEIQFGLATRQEGLDLLRTSIGHCKSAKGAAERGGLGGFVGLMAVARAVARDDEEFLALGGEIPGPAVWASLQHGSLGLMGTGGTLIAADTLMHDHWARAAVATESWQRCSVMYSGEKPFSSDSDPRVAYGLMNGVAGLSAGISLGARFWKEWFALGS